MSELQIPPPTDLKLHRRSRELEVRFADGMNARLRPSSCASIRRRPRSKATRPAKGMLVTGKEAVNIASIEPVGRYAVRLVFDDGHNTGLYTWAVLYELCSEHDQQVAAIPGEARRGRQAAPSRAEVGRITPESRPVSV